MNKVNYNKEMNRIIDECSQGEKRTLLLHACCAPCSSTCMERVREYFDTTVYFFNPNITNEEEYNKRAEELGRLIEIYNGLNAAKTADLAGGDSLVCDGLADGDAHDNSACDGLAGGDGMAWQGAPIKLITDEYNPRYFIEIAKGYEGCPERGERCKRCFELRLRQSALMAKEKGFDYFTTTLTLSPLKDEQLLNQIGYRIAEEIGGISWLPSDFKKEGGYQRSIELSREYNLYRQDFCGCVYSKNQREKEKAASAQETQSAK